MTRQSAGAAGSDVLPSKAPNVQNGTYTVSSPDGHFTIKLHTAQKGDLAGKRILSLLTGPDNESHFTSAAFWDDEKKRAFVWRRFRGVAGNARIDGYHWPKDGELARWSAYEQKLAIWSDLVLRGSDEKRNGFWFGEGYRLLREGRCVRCNRKLTDPESIRTGIGPVCGGRT